MASPTPHSSPVPAGDDRPLVVVDAPVVVPFDEKLRLFWVRNKMAITAFCILVLVVIVAKGGWEAFQAHKETEISEAYGKASTGDQLKAFAASHEGHALAGVAHLRLADEAYAAGKYADAIPHYTKAAEAMKANPLAPRALVGAAVSKLLSGDRAGGQSALKALASDMGQSASVRGEATYHLASLAAEAGDDATLQTLVTQLNAIGPQSFWAQRATYLRAQAAGISVTPATSPTANSVEPPAPQVTFPSPAK